MDYKNLVAIDIHTHAEVSCWNALDNYEALRWHGYAMAPHASGRLSKKKQSGRMAGVM